MTICTAWVRTTNKGAQELLLVSDSRLSGAGYLDSSPKVFTLPRSDAAICFAGDTYFAYPLIIQIIQSIQSHYPLMDRAIDYIPFRTHTIKILNEIFANFDTYIEEFKKPDTSFLLCGYSWFKKEFHIDKIEYRASKNQFEHTPCTKGVGNFGKVLFIGDYAKTANKKLTELLIDQHGHESVTQNSTVTESFGYEPFMVLRDLLRSAGATDTIGGAPQMVSISQHMNSRHTAVYWPKKEGGKIHLGGRPVFDFENIENWIIDPDTFTSDHLMFNK